MSGVEVSNLAVSLLIFKEMNTDMTDLNAEVIEINLIDSAKQGNARAFELLAAKYQRLLEWYVRQLNLPVSEKDDFIQEGLIGLLKAVRTYDNKSSSFLTYASLCIKSSIISAVRKYNKSFGTLVSYDDISDDTIPDVTGSPESNFIDRESIGILYNKVFSVLSGYELSVFEMYLSGMSYDGMAAKLNREPKSVGNAVYRIKKKLKQTIKPN
jgi:RNA polymerase sporulation-specific sigma factor